MANELKHKSVGTELTQAEYEAVGGHEFDSQATGDILYASSATQLSRLAKGTSGYFLKQGASIPEWAAVSVATIVRKTDDQTVNNTTTLQNDDDLLLAVDANEIWQIVLHVRFNSSAVADLKVAFTVPSGGVIKYQYFTTGDEADGTSGILQPGSGNDRAHHPYWLYIGGANAGNVQFQWAQNTAEESNTTVLVNSNLICHKLA